MQLEKSSGESSPHLNATSGSSAPRLGTIHLPPSHVVSPGFTHSRPLDSPAHPSPLTRNVPYFAAKHCNRVPDRSLQERYRFPTSEMLQVESIPCSSNQCSKSNTPNGTPRCSPAASPTNSPGNSRSSSLLRCAGPDGTIGDRGSEAHAGSVGSLRTHTGSQRCPHSLGFPCTQVPVAHSPSSLAPIPPAPFPPPPWPQTPHPKVVEAHSPHRQAHSKRDIRVGVAKWNHDVAHVLTPPASLKRKYTKPLLQAKHG